MVHILYNLLASAGDARDTSVILGLGNPQIRIDNLLQYSCLEKSMDRGARQAAVHGVRNSRTRLSMHVLLRCRLDRS